MTELTGKQKRALRALGHDMRPLVQVGRHGLSPGVLRQVEDCLLAHELVKVKVLEGAPRERRELARALAGATGAAVAQVLGRTVLLYRPHPEHPQIVLPPG